MTKLGGKYLIWFDYKDWIRPVEKYLHGDERLIRNKQNAKITIPGNTSLGRHNK